MAEPPCAAEKELTGRVAPSASCREEGLTSGTRSSVTTLRGGEARAVPVWAERGRAGLRAEFLGRSRHSVYFPFLLCNL